MSLKIMNVVGARQNFMKIVPLMAEFKKHPQIEASLIHTGQHYDEKMSRLFFDDLGIPKPFKFCQKCAENTLSDTKQ